MVKKTHLPHLLLGNEQFGSQPCKSLMDMVLWKSLTYVVTNQEKMKIIPFYNDTSSCYDHILLVLVALASCHIGMLEVAFQVMNRCLAGMKYFTREEEGVGDH